MNILLSLSLTLSRSRHLEMVLHFHFSGQFFYSLICVVFLIWNGSDIQNLANLEINMIYVECHFSVIGNCTKSASEKN